MSRWIRSPGWDGTWILGGMPVGLLLIVTSMWVAPRVLSLLGTVVLGFGHVLAPISLAWIHPETRKIALAKRMKFIGLPALILAAAAGVGLVAHGLPPISPDLTFGSVAVQPSDYRNPLVGLMIIYMIWNAYHFGMQNFGVLTIYRIKSGRKHAGQRRWDLGFCLVTVAIVTAIPLVPHLPFRAYLFEPVEWGVVAWSIGSIVILLGREWKSGLGAPRAMFIVSTALGPMLMLWWPAWATSAARQWTWLPRVPLWPSLWAFALLSMNHWLVSIGLAGHVFSRRRCGSLWMFVGAVTLVGTALFAVAFVDLRTMTIHVTALAISLRLGLGFVHFLYDRWLYRFSDPALRATLGEDLFGEPQRPDEGARSPGPGRSPYFEQPIPANAGSLLQPVIPR